jgi:hypothetical protein
VSYDLRIWEQPADEAIPDSFEAAVRIWSKLEGLEPGPNPKFAALAERMIELEDDGDSPWIGDPLAQAKDWSSAVWGFSLPLESRVHLLHAVVKRANALGLTVFDDQLGLMFCPPDRVLPPEQAEMWQAAAEELDSSGWRWAPRKSWTLPSVRKGIESSLAAILTPHGFVAEQPPAKSPYYHQKPFAVYHRPTLAGGQTVMLLGETIDHSPFIIIDVNVFSTAIANITRAVFPEHGEMYARRQLDLRPGLFYGEPIYVPIKSPEDVQRLLKAVEDPVVPILELTRTSAGMEAIMGGAVGFPITNLHYSTRKWSAKTLAEYSQQNYGYAPLISAWLHGNEQFETLREDKRESDRLNAPPADTEEMAQRVDRVAAYLREHVKRDPRISAGS